MESLFPKPEISCFKQSVVKVNPGPGPVAQTGLLVTQHIIEQPSGIRLEIISQNARRTKSTGPDNTNKVYSQS